MIGAVFSAALLLAQAAPAAMPPAAAPAPVVTSTSAPAQKVNKDGLICHSEQILGTRIPKRVCFTPEEAEQRRLQDKANLERMQSQNGYVHN
jgi:hypothetical protein